MKPVILYTLLLNIICCCTVICSCGSHATPSSKTTRKDTTVNRAPAIRDSLIARNTTLASDTTLMARDTPAPARDPTPDTDPPGIKQIRPADLVNSRIIPDTTISYDVDEENLSLEGNEVKVHYIRNIWTQADWRIFGESGQGIIRYQTIGDSLVRVEERSYHYYHMSMEHSNKPWILDYHVVYLIDTSGNIRSISRGKKEDIRDVFLYFKKYVPFILLIRDSSAVGQPANP